MIRWLFAVLVLANVGAWLWVSSYMEPPVVSEPARPPVHPELMKLIGEPGVKLKSRPTSPAESAPAPAAAGTPHACYRAGPYTDLDAVVAAGKRLDGRGVTSMRREETSRKVTGYRVFLPPFPTKRAAEARRRELVKLGISDIALVQEHDRYGISLGLFSVKENAYDRRRDLAAKGIKSQLKPMQQAHTIYWLELRGDNLFEALKKFDWGAPGVALAEYPCTTSSNGAPPAPHP